MLFYERLLHYGSPNLKYVGLALVCWADFHQMMNLFGGLDQRGISQKHRELSWS